MASTIPDDEDLDALVRRAGDDPDALAAVNEYISLLSDLDEALEGPEPEAALQARRATIEQARQRLPQQSRAAIFEGMDTPSTPGPTLAKPSPDSIPGLKYAVAMFMPGVERAVQNLDLERRGADRDDREVPLYISEHLRGVLHTYAMVVGGLKLMLAQAEGREWQHLFVAHDDFQKAIEAQEEVYNQLPATKDPVKLDKLEEQWETAKRFADAKAIEFATK